MEKAILEVTFVLILAVLKFVQIVRGFKYLTATTERE